MSALAQVEVQAAPKLLIADDDPAVVKLLADRCTKMGFQVLTATNGMQLLIKARQSEPDALIVDVNMPQLDGLAASAQILEPGGKPIDVIVMTGSSDRETLERCEGLGMLYSRKGPDFWQTIQRALIEIFPKMADQIMAQAITSGDSAVVPGRPRVLVVDDDPAVAAHLSSRLAKYGVDTLFATNATEAFRMARRQRPSVILTDYNMPGGNADHLIARLRSAPETGKIPVLVLTGSDLDEMTERDLRREILGHPGAAGIFRKSFDIRELFGALEEFCAFDKAQPKP